MSESAASENYQIVVTIGKHAIVIFPGEEVDLGIIGDDEVIATRRSLTASGIKLEAFRLKANDPMLS